MKTNPRSIHNNKYICNCYILRVHMRVSYKYYPVVSGRLLLLLFLFGVED